PCHAQSQPVPARGRDDQGLQRRLQRRRPLPLPAGAGTGDPQGEEHEIGQEQSMKVVSQSRSHGGVQGVYQHDSAACHTEMTFAVFLPPQAEKGPCPVLWYLSGLTCTHANVMEKGEYRRLAAELGLIIVCPDTSPRGDQVA